jgi:hypothetical protein
MADGHARATKVPRVAYVGAVMGLCLMACAGIVVLLVADSWELSLNLATTAVALVLFGLAAAVATSVIGVRPLAWIGWLGIAVAVVGFGLTMGTLWSLPEEGVGNEALAKASGILFVFSIALAVVSRMLGQLGSDDNRLVGWVIGATVLAVLALAALFTIAILEEVESDTYYRAVAVVAVLWALGTALVPLLRLLRRAA